MSEKIMKSLANCEQGLTDEQKLQARTNIGAIGGVKVADGSGTTPLVPDANGYVTVDLSEAGKVQSDWDETNPAEPSYIRNKPDIPAMQVQSDWTEQDTTDPSYIQNKPALASVATSGSYDDLQDKPSIPAAQVQSDWSQSDNTAVDYIKNKPAAMETKPLVAGTNISFSSTASETAINSTATKVVSRSSPYTTVVDITDLTVYDPGEDHGSLLQVQGGTTIGMLVPKHYGASDLGKVLTVVSDNGYKTEWKAAPGDLKPLTTVTSTLNTVSEVVLDVADGNAYSLELGDSVSAYVSLSTSSTSTVHTLVYVKNPSGSLCGSVTLAWRDAALNQHTAEILLTDSAYTYCFDVYVRKVTVGASDYAIASVHDYPVAYRKGLVSFSTANETTQMVGVWRT